MSWTFVSPKTPYSVYNLGLCIASWGFGAEMMYSLNFGFWSSVSFFSPDDFTSGFTGSGGFSLLWAPFVQPCEERVTVLDSQTMSNQANMLTAKVTVNAYENNRQQRHDHGGLTVWIKTETKTYNNAEEIGEVSSSSFAAWPSLEKARDTLTLTR